MLADSTRIEGADYASGLAGDRIVGYGKEIPDAETDAEYVGMALIRRGFVERFAARLERMIEAQETGSGGRTSSTPSSRGRPGPPRDVAGTFWAEVDYVEDYERILAWLAGHPGNG